MRNFHRKHSNMRKRNHKDESKKHAANISAYSCVYLFISENRSFQWAHCKSKLSSFVLAFTFGDKTWVDPHIWTHITGKKQREHVFEKRQSVRKIQFYFSDFLSRDGI